MLGRIKWGSRRKIIPEREILCGLPIFEIALPQEAGVRALRKCARILIKHGVTRLLTPPGFDRWPFLLQYGLRPVDTRAFRCALAAAWVRSALRNKGIAPEQAVLRLSGARESAEMAHVARELCSWIRNIVIDVPGEGGLAFSLRREYGLPVLPRNLMETDLTLAFDEGPLLVGVQLSLPSGGKLPDDIEMLPTFSILWENQLIKTQDIAVKVDFS